MICVDEAMALVVQHAQVLPTVRAPLSDAVGLVLDENVCSDIASPPHDKSLVDGYAVICADCIKGVCELTLREEVVAGSIPEHAVSPGTAIRIMTGTPIPAGADAVVMVEHTELLGPRRIRIDDMGLNRGQNIMMRGSSIRQSEIVLTRGTVIRPVEVGVLAEIGRTQVEVKPGPTVATLATGNELVPCGRPLGPGKIRNSNGPMLSAAVKSNGGRPIDLGIARDEEAELIERIQQGLQADILLLSGGVSVGVADLVPQALASAGVERVFHRVSLKPGKPVWFGVKKTGDDRPTMVFGLPGNPVSSLVCFELFVRTAMAQLSGLPTNRPQATVAQLGATFCQRSRHPTYHPARWTDPEKRTVVEPIVWHGSADLSSLIAADVLIHFPEGDSDAAIGQPVQVWPL